MATPSNIPVRPPNAVMATEQYVRRRAAPRRTTRRAPARKPAKKAPVKKSPYRAAAPRMPSRVAMKVSDCSMRYMATICDPFEAEPGACVPCDLFPLPSQKIRAFGRGQFSLGTTGFGFIQVNPCSALDATAATFTTPTSVMTSTTQLGSVTNTAASQLQTLPYNQTQVTGTTSVQARMVACGLRVRYSGTEGGRSGTIVCYEEQDHQSLTAETYLSSQQAPSSITSRPSGDGTWDGTVCSSGPVSPQELEFTSLVYPNTAPLSQLPTSGYLLIAISGLPGDKYDFELFEHIEYIGSSVVAKTPSHADTDQYGKIVQSAKEISAVQPVTPASGPGLFERFSKKVSESLPTLVNMGVGAVRAFEGDPGGYAQLLGGAASMILGDGPGPSPNAPRIGSHRTRSNQQYPARLTDRQRSIVDG